MHLLLIWILSALSLMVAAYLLPTVEIESFGTAMIAAVLIGLLNATLGFLIRVMAFPLTWLLPGLMYLICDAIMIWIVSRFLRGFAVKNFTAAFLCALVVAVVNMLLGGLA
ncbi:putative membrane protein [Terriglobus roseus DSM 18391]|uniref:Putative membrane protein n=1 Tax=Terriglobus roseus (strain DSM 18391 / NRRL B-41598 / KBS 63) TaxID=926566 RepID=I3ZLD0_TERRK|nr:phage holin family protein [Terriglobus roseus]AFL90048.1 putative membrane protein [Terriglobus roseus DSM 18391]